MTLRVVTPTSGAAQIGISYQPGGTAWPETDTLTAGQILDVLPGSPLETALGSNITALTGAALTSAITGSGGQGTGNA